MIVAVPYSLAIGFCIAAMGVMLGVWLGDLALGWGLLKPNADIDDDAMILSMGFATGGGVVGFILGVLFGWRVITARTVRR